MALSTLDANPLSKLTNTGTIRELSFPVDLASLGHSVTFRAAKRTTKSISNSVRGQTQLKKIENTIHLPMPSSLPVAYGVGYNNEDLGVLGAAAISIATDTVNSLLKDGPAAASLKLVRDIGKAVTSPGAGAAALNKLGSAVAGLGSSTIKAAVADVKGIAPNPHRVVLFQGVEFREHQFLFRLSPKNREESNIITAMIHKFKYHMHPSFASNRAWFNYPEIFDIVFQNSDHLYAIAPSVLKSITVQYHPQGYPAYIRDEATIAPAEVELNLTFQEIEIITKEFIEREVNNWGAPPGALEASRADDIDGI